MARSRSRSPTLVTLALIGIVFAVQQLFAVLPRVGVPLALSRPLLDQPWTLVTSVYAHASVTHLLANALTLALLGFPLERQTTRGRFHLFFLLTGVIAGVAQVSFVGALASLWPWVPASVSVLGASGAIFGLLGYLLASNRVTALVMAGFSLAPRVQLVLGAILAVAITLATANPGVAIVAHFTGLLIGLLAGREHLLRPGRSPGS